jgi:D-ribose pyranase
MKTKGILHPQLNRVLAEIRHKDTIIIGDAGLPVPKGVERIDLDFIPGVVPYLDVLKAIMEEQDYNFESAIFAEEAKTVSPEFHKKALALLPKGIDISYVPHTKLKEMSKDAKAIILTGEYTGYTNVILTSGCAY